MDYDYIEGKGDIIFFLHGWGGDKNSFSIVKNQISKDCGLVFVSFVGFGNSPPPTKPYKLIDYVLDLKNLIIKIAKGKKVNIVCHSFGARVAVKLAVIYPELVDKLIIVDGAGLKPKRKLNYYLKVWKFKRLKNRVNKGKLDPKVLENYGSEDYKKLSDVMKKTFVNIVNEDLKNYYKAVTQKTLIFWGEKDTETPLYMAKKINKYINGSILYVVSYAGHFSYLDDADGFINCLNNFLF